jgi:hypothetical protein
MLPNNPALAPYCTIDYLKRTAFQTKTKDEFLQEDKIVAASRFFDSLTGHEPGYFSQAMVEPSLREFRGNGTQFLPLPAYVLSSIIDLRYKNGGLLPEYSETPRSFILEFPDCFVLNKCDVVEVTARWGFDPIPADIQEAVAELVVAMWRQRDTAYLRVIAESNNGLQGGVSGQALPERTRAAIQAHARRVIIS